MSIFDLYSKRQKRSRGEMPDVYSYDSLPQALRVQIIHIVRDAFQQRNCSLDQYARKAYEFINESLCREFGVFNLTDHAETDDECIFDCLLKEPSTEKTLDVVEMCFKVIHGYVTLRFDRYNFGIAGRIKPDAAVSELNERFREHGVGYQFQSGEIIRVDSEVIHSEAVKPTLALLRDKKFKGANEEFLKAHEHYRHGRYKECLVDSLKAFESTMKTICTLNRWSFDPNDNAKKLIDTCIKNNLFPSYFETQYASLRALLESGVPTTRNKNGAHGQGPDPVLVPEYMARYGLNLTATTILFLVEAHQASK